MELQLQGLDVERPIAFTIQESWWHRLTAKALLILVIEDLANHPESSWQVLRDAEGFLPEPPLPALHQFIEGSPSGLFTQNEFALWHGDRRLPGDATLVDALHLPNGALLHLRWMPPLRASGDAELLNPVED